jgi:predicted extracellular nuclease
MVHSKEYQMRRYTCTFAIVVSLSINLTALAAERCDTPLSIGSWNIEWLGNAKEGKRTAQSPSDMADYLMVADINVLALSEISSTNSVTGEARNQQLDETFARLSINGASWQYRLFEKRPGARAPDDQWTGLAWNTAKVQLVGEPWKIDTNIDEAKEKEIAKQLSKESGTIIWSRTPYAVKLAAASGKTDFIIVPVHMKSNSGGTATAKAREYEATLLVQGLKKLRTESGEKDIIVLGDSNMLSSSEPAATVLKDFGFTDCNARDMGTHISFNANEKGAPFDRIFVMKDQNETKESCPSNGDGSAPLDFRIVRPEDWIHGMTPSEFRKKLSDHMLVRTGLCIGADDD